MAAKVAHPFMCLPLRIRIYTDQRNRPGGEDPNMSANMHTSTDQALTEKLSIKRRDSDQRAALGIQ